MYNLEVCIQNCFSVCPRVPRLTTVTPDLQFNVVVGLRFNLIHATRNTLDCDQSNYSSRIVFSHIPIECGHTGNSAIRSADPENPTVESNMKWIGRPLAEIWPFEIFQM